MSRDYAKQRKAPKARPKPKSQVPGWVWLFTGSVIGAFVMFLVYLKDVPPESSSVLNALKNDDKTPTDEPVAKTDGASEKAPEPRFVFYELLKENEVSIKVDPESELAAAKPPKNVEYIIQAGSFKNEKDADRLRAELILKNMEARVEKRMVGEQAWHRVMVGPFKTRAMASKARSTLASMNVDTIMREQKNDG